MSLSDGDFDSLDSPLLEADHGDGDDGSPSIPATPMGGTAGGGGITLHGETVDLLHMFPSGVGSHSMLAKHETADEEEEDDFKDDGGDVVEKENQQTTSDVEVSPTCTLSLDDNQSSLTNAPPSTAEYVKQTLLFLPKKGRRLFYTTRYNVATYISSRRANPSGGLTPVNDDAASTSVVANSTPSASRTKKKSKKQKNKHQITQSSSLFSSPSTPLLLKLLIPPLLIANHVLFYHAQTAPMWNLAYKTNVTITATASTLKSKTAADVLNLPHHYEFAKDESSVVKTFTYMDAIRELWKGDSLGDAQTISKIAAALLVVFSGIWPHLKLLLVHLCWFVPFVHKLWLRNGDDDDDDEGCCSRCKNNGNGSTKTKCSLCCSNGHTHQSRTIRSPFLRFLSTLGKWSLADILVVCILIAVLHLDWYVHPEEIRAGIENQLPTLLQYANDKYPDLVQDCTQLLGYTCGRHALVLHQPACLACQGLIRNAFHHPEWTTNEGKDILEGVTLEGGGHAQLRVQGMVGTYYFCAAVIASILLGLLVDLMDERDRGRVEEDLVDRKRELEFIVPGQEGGGNELELRDESVSALNGGEDSTSAALNEALMSDEDQSASQRRHATVETYSVLAGSGSPHRASTSPYSIPTPTTNCYLLKQAVLVLLSISSLPLVCYAVTLPTMERLVYGGGPTLLHEVLGMVWEKEYSLIALVKTTGDAGGWDIFLMLTFGLFAVVGPILRSVCLIIHVLLGLPLALLGDCIERPRQRTTLRMLLYRATSAVRNALLPVIDALGAFGCWEVLLVALVMIQLEMPSITDTIHDDPRCEQVDPAHGQTCIEVQFNALDNFLVVAVAWVVLTAACGLAMDVAGDMEAKTNEYSLVGGQEEQTRYEFGASIPQRRSNFSRDRAWMDSATTGNGQENNNATDCGNEEVGDEYFSPLQQGGEQRNGLEQIVFV